MNQTIKHSLHIVETLDWHSWFIFTSGEISVCHVTV